MISGPPRRPPLTLINGSAAGGGTAAPDRTAGAAGAREIDWSILMAHAQAGDAAAYRRLLTEISPFLRRLAARRQDDPGEVEDALQDILLTIHAIRHTYDPTRPFGPWLVAIANRRLIDRLRQQGRRRSRESPLTVEHETFAADQPNLDEGTVDRQALHDAIETLPAGQREAIRLLKLKEMSLKEASAATGLSVAALKVATHRAIAGLRKALSNRSQDP